MSEYKLNEERKIIPVPTIKDYMGNILEHILLVPLYGDKYKFSNYKDALDYIKTIPERPPHTDLTFVRFEIKIVYQDNEEISIRFNTKEKVSSFIKTLFEEK